MSNENDKVIKVTEYGDKKDSGKSGAKIEKSVGIVQFLKLSAQ